ncbi:hypothetical protein E3N88_01121 [Mikania micrantha]|uniref:Uncharacterized protein n=1 Tax=Mikania micrantha TaxID=192012 RepID=A0A5N6Q035_9ASTR|nr:hypothetical protein E3N88_01121 [Mikania micrantha]
MRPSSSLSPAPPFPLPHRRSSRRSAATPSQQQEVTHRRRWRWRPVMEEMDVAIDDGDDDGLVKRQWRWQPAMEAKPCAKQSYELYGIAKRRTLQKFEKSGASRFHADFYVLLLSRPEIIPRRKISYFHHQIIILKAAKHPDRTKERFYKS